MKTVIDDMSSNEYHDFIWHLQHGTNDPALSAYEDEEAALLIHDFAFTKLYVKYTGLEFGHAVLTYCTEMKVEMVKERVPAWLWYWIEVARAQQRIFDLVSKADDKQIVAWLALSLHDSRITDMDVMRFVRFALAFSNDQIEDHIQPPEEAVEALTERLFSLYCLNN